VESKAAETRRRVRQDVARILDYFAYKRKLYYLQRKEPPHLYVPSHEDIRCAYILASMKTVKFKDLKKRIDEYFKKLPLILEEDPDEITFSHFAKWANRL